MAPLARTVCITRGALGCWVLKDGEVTAVPGVPAQAVDTNGAGDMFAGAFLYAVTHGHGHTQAAMLGNLAAAAVVSQHGNRLTTAQLQDIKNRFEAQQAAPR
jgi:sugar/nucleoside kinase (ribokinase family)